jgi:aryl-alcohol dehydrogenase-like predicted oxidoreductase
MLPESWSIKRTSMQMRPLGSTGLSITPIGVGAWAMGGGGWAYSLGPQDDHDSIGAIQSAIEAGINWIDTAPVYGLGHSEEVVARALEGIAPRPLVFTKCGMIWNERGEVRRCLKAESIRREIEASLRRLRAESIDLCQIHWPDPDRDIEEAWSTLVELKREGKVRHIGVSNFSVRQLKRIGRLGPVATIQPPYSLLNRRAEESILPYAGKNGIGVISYSPMKSGLLSGLMTRERVANFPSDDLRRKMPEYQEPCLSRNLELAETLKKIGLRQGFSAGQVAISWVLRNPAITGAIAGIRSRFQLKEILGANDFTWSEDDVAEIQVALAKIKPSGFRKITETAKKFARRVLGR